nr:MAG TPA: hypothetical protein [Caudoviricetes sp.]
MRASPCVFPAEGTCSGDGPAFRGLYGVVTILTLYMEHRRTGR